jgi:hypothetical protein
MRLAIPFSAALLLFAAAPQPAAAQFGQIFGPLGAPLDALTRGMGRAIRPPAHRPRANAASQSAAATPSAQRQDGLAQTPEPAAFWPSAASDLFGYVLTKEASFWSRGYGDILASMFQQPSDKIVAAQARAASDSQDRTTATGPGTGRWCTEAGLNQRDEITKNLGEGLSLNPAQQQAFAELRAALARAYDEIAAACPKTLPAAVPDRLRAMQDRLWSLHVTALMLREPLQKFYNTLDGDQKARLDAAQGDPQTEGRAGQRGGDQAKQLCLAQAQRGPSWPSDLVARAIRPTKDQQTSLAAVGKAFAEAARQTLGSCPQHSPATPVARLDAALDRLDSLFFVSTSLVPVVDELYGSLNSRQRTDFDAMKL